MATYAVFGQKMGSGGGTPATVPGAPTIGTATRASGTSVSVTFTAPSSDGGSAITGYTVTSTPGGITATGVSSPITVTGLTTGTAYTFKVKATNAIGDGPESAASNSATPATVPGAPTIGTATVASSTSASVTFTAPGSTGGSPITGYTVTSSPGGITGTGASSPITVSGLTSGTAYTFTVTATNAVGNSSASAASNSVTPGAKSIYVYTSPSVLDKVSLDGTVVNNSWITGVPSSPTQWVASSTGYIYISSNFSSNIAKVDPVNQTITNIPIGFSQATLAADNSGNVYAGENETLKRISSSDVVTTYPAGTLPTGLRPQSMTYDSVSNRLVMITNSPVIVRIYDISGGFASTITSLTDGNYVSVICDSSGNIYTARSASSGSASILKITPGGSTSTFATTPGAAYAKSFGFDAAGNLYMLSDFNSMFKITPAGVLTTIASQSFSPPFYDVSNLVASNNGGIAVDASGNVYTPNDTFSAPQYVARVPSGGSIDVNWTSLGATSSNRWGIVIADG